MFLELGGEELDPYELDEKQGEEVQLNDVDKQSKDKLDLYKKFPLPFQIGVDELNVVYNFGFARKDV